MRDPRPSEVPHRRPRILRAHLASHYVHGTGDSNEHGLFHGLFPSMGFDEVFQPFESVDSRLCMEKTRDFGPYDVAFFMPYKDIPTWIRDVVGPNVPIIAWMPDDVWRFDFTSRLIAANAADVFITTHPPALTDYARLGAKAVFSAFGTRPDWWPRLVKRPETPLAQATFTGLCYGDRLARLQAIANAGSIPIDVHDTQSSVLPLADYHQTMADSAFTLALTASSHGMPQMKARLFEPQLHGSVLVVESFPGIEEVSFLKPGVDCLSFSRPEEAQSKMLALLSDPVAYHEMAEQAFYEAIVNRSFQRRFACVFDRLGIPYAMPDFSAALAPDTDPYAGLL